MNVTFFFRKKQVDYHSIEELFGAIQSKLPSDVKYRNFVVPFESNSIRKLYANATESGKHQATINHITGDIHYIAARLNKQNTILTIHDLGPMHNYVGTKKSLVKYLWYDLPVKRVRYVTVISEFTKQELLKHIQVDPQKIKVIPNCVHPKIEYKPKFFNKKKPNILHIGTKSNKNLPRLIEALKGISCKLLIIGKIDDKILTQLADHNIDFEHFHNLKFSAVIDLYERADMVSFVSTYEGFGMPIIEANTIGRVIITSNISPMKDIANHSALLVDPTNVESIREGVCLLIENEEYRNKLINNGLVNAKKYTAEAVAKQYVDLYASILNSE